MKWSTKYSLCFSFIITLNEKRRIKKNVDGDGVHFPWKIRCPESSSHPQQWYDENYSEWNNNFEWETVKKNDVKGEDGKFYGKKKSHTQQQNVKKKEEKYFNTE